MSIEICFICQKNSRKYQNQRFLTFKKNPLDKGKGFKCECYFCGEYKINQNAIEFLKKLPPKQRENKYKLQSYIREQNDEFRNIPELIEKKTNYRFT